MSRWSSVVVAAGAEAGVAVSDGAAGSGAVAPGDGCAAAVGAGTAAAAGAGPAAGAGAAAVVDGGVFAQAARNAQSATHNAQTPAALKRELPVSLRFASSIVH